MTKSSLVSSYYKSNWLSSGSVNAVYSQDGLKIKQKNVPNRLVLTEPKIYFKIVSGAIKDPPPNGLSYMLCCSWVFAMNKKSNEVTPVLQRM